MGDLLGCGLRFKFSRGSNAVDVCHGTFGKRRGTDKFEIERPREGCKKRKSGAERYGMYKQVKLVDKAELDEALREAGATVGEEILSGLLLEARDLVREVA